MKLQAKRWAELADRLEEINEELERLEAEKLQVEDELYDLDNEDDGTVRREAARIMEAW
jgi:septation ring formation regulator EzrA